MPIKLRIVTPEREIFSDLVDGTVIPGIEGELGILPMHIPLVTALTPGDLSYRKDGMEHHLAVGEGLVEVTQDHISILTDLAAQDAEINEAEVQAALDRAKEMAARHTHDTNPEEIAAVQVAIQKAMAQLRVKRKRHSI